MPNIRPFTVEIPQADLDDLQRRLESTRWPAASTEEAHDWSSGTPEPYLRELVDYWRDSFDWRAAEARINAFDQFQADVNGSVLHFIHARSPHPDATPLLLVNGWPSSIVEYLHVIERLTDPVAFGGTAEQAFHVVVPSLHGYGFSRAATDVTVTPEIIARDFTALMVELGYDRFTAQGSDWGTVVCRYLTDQHAAHLLGVHLVAFLATPPQGLDDPESLLSAEEKAFIDDAAAAEWDLTGYLHLQATKPQSLAYGLSDSPVGLAAWVAEKFDVWSDHDTDLREVISWDDLLTTISLYWFTNTIGSSIRLYQTFFSLLNQGIPFQAQVDVRTGVTVFPAEPWQRPRAWVEYEYDLISWRTAEKGGHFAALEQPETAARELWLFNDALRGA